ncbi:M64 family metallopeptidase [Tamlana sp. 2201CG12-4]|uniref:T9SS type A sorting domain-containing protein n=1 Tax=Tamlana sp. 2201CG12-4 TaxID=3112582 RepID=UPI002DB5A386|nr:M64 family metallopeptidase [Tamlana sp. 2201CG12-4]MEC3906890.1 M64 family metallopeptidase [Tamlana sp. 2201CG12-4]
MKLILYFLIIVETTLFSYSQTFDIETIKYSGNNDKRINLVFLSDGYQSGELDQFITEASNFTTTMFNTSPFKEYKHYFNVYAIKIPSNDSGADHPANATDTDETGATPEFYDTYFNATFDAYGIHRLLFYGIDGVSAGNTEVKIENVLMDHFPAYDSAIILVNTTTYGGSGGKFPITYNGFWGANVTIHELGHSLFDLKDEYYPGDALVGEAINMTQETNTGLVKWKNWLNTSNVGIYPYGNTGVAATWYKPHQNCIMEHINKSFCPVCKEGIIEKIHDLVSPIDSYTPNSNTINNPGFPLDFQLSLINPDPNTLTRVWTLNTLNVANNVDELSVLETDLVNGANTLTATVYDDTVSLRVDNHNSLHVNTITWTINYSTLGVKTIDSEVTRYDITLYPNPSNTFINLKFESQSTANLRVSISGLDGKQIKSTTISNHVNTPIDISDLSTGIYLAHFYLENTLIATKKIAKN